MSYYFKRHPALAIILFSVIAIVTIDFLAANIYKMVVGYPWGMKDIVETRMFEKSFRTNSSIYHHDLAKNRSVSHYEDGMPVSIFINSLGFRDSHVRDVALISDKYRILFIGDSFTEGVGVNYEDTFVGIIDSELSKNGVEVLNAAVSSYCPVIYWRKLKYLIEEIGLKVNEVVVFLDLSDINDEATNFYLNEEGNVICNDEGKPGNSSDTIQENLPWYKSFLKYNTILVYTISNFINDKLFPRNYRLGYERVLWTTDEHLYKKYGERGIKRVKFYMDNVYELLKKHGIKLTLAVYPWPDQIVNEDLDSIQRKIWLAWCNNRGVTFIDYFPYFIKGKADDEKRKTLDRYFIKNNVHWNKEGHRLIANVFLDNYRDVSKEPEL